MTIAPLWRLILAILVAPIVPIALFVWLIEPQTWGAARDYTLLIALPAWPGTAIVGVPLWLVQRRRETSWGWSALFVGLLALTPWALIWAASGALPQSSDGRHGVGDLLGTYWSTGELPLILAQCFALGVLGGAIFHLVAFGWRRGWSGRLRWSIG